MDGLNIFNEIQRGWVSLIMYQRWTGTFAVAKFDHSRGKFIGDIMACAGSRHISSLWHAHEVFTKQARNFQ